jgi:hypothetical protein
MERCRIYTKCRLFYSGGRVRRFLIKTRTRWKDVVFALNVEFYSGDRVRRFLLKTRNRWADVVFILNVVFYSGGRVRSSG